VSLFSGSGAAEEPEGEALKAAAASLLTLAEVALED
jgi:hypothetical protein